MISRRFMLTGGAAGVAVAALAMHKATPAKAAVVYPLTLTDVQWRSRLTPAQYAVLRQAGTEIPFTSPLLKEHRAGLFSCAGCSQDAFSSKTKFESGTGWPSFWAPLPNAVATSNDRSLGVARTEVHCSRCGGHLGHVFDDGPRPTGLRYCMNGQAMTFRPAAV
jgi:peptide-methionine (R)-S-oxide reductase